MIGGEDVIQMPMEKLRQFRQQKTAMVFQSFALLPHKTLWIMYVWAFTCKG